MHTLGITLIENATSDYNVRNLFNHKMSNLEKYVVVHIEIAMKIQHLLFFH